MNVDEALNDIIQEKIQYDKEYHATISDCYTVRIQDLAKTMHTHYFRYREEILNEIHEWVANHPEFWIDKEGRKWKIGYGEQMHPYYGYFKRLPAFGRVPTTYDILELWRQK